MRKKFLLNTTTSIVLHILTIIGGMILPRLFLEYYGSEVNGLVHSVGQFLSIISFLELGLGAVIQSALYKPLAQNDNDQISRIIVSGNKFYKRLALAFLLYVIVLAVAYPLLFASDFDFVSTAFLIIAMSLSSFAQYYFGIVDGILLSSDQRAYINDFSQILSLFVNIIVCIVFILWGSSIQIVKIASSLVYMIRPLMIRWYVNHHYKINRKIKYDTEPIKQKWNGVYQHIAYVILNNTDTVVLTIFSTLSNVSVYSVYNMIVCGIKQLIMSSTSGVMSMLGNLWAREEKEMLKKAFGSVELMMHLLCSLLFTCCGILILPFIRIYTLDITDADYIQPWFSLLIIMAHGIHCVRLPYSLMILAGGHYKQTQSNYIIAAILNVVISIASVKIWGLVGVAVGTLVSMAYQTIWMARYTSKNLVQWPFKTFVTQCLFDVVYILLTVLATSWIELTDTTYFSWILMACKVFGIAFGILAIMSVVFYKKRLVDIKEFLFRKNANSN